MLLRVICRLTARVSMRVSLLCLTLMTTMFVRRARIPMFMPTLIRMLLWSIRDTTTRCGGIGRLLTIGDTRGMGGFMIRGTPGGDGVVPTMEGGMAAMAGGMILGTPGVGMVVGMGAIMVDGMAAGTMAVIMAAVMGIGGTTIVMPRRTGATPIAHTQTDIARMTIATTHRRGALRAMVATLRLRGAPLRVTARGPLRQVAALLVMGLGHPLMGGHLRGGVPLRGIVRALRRGVVRPGIARGAHRVAAVGRRPRAGAALIAMDRRVGVRRRVTTRGRRRAGAAARIITTTRRRGAAPLRATTRGRRRVGAAALTAAGRLRVGVALTAVAAVTAAGRLRGGVLLRVGVAGSRNGGSDLGYAKN